MYPHPKRKTTSLLCPPERAGDPIIFITVCTKHRIPWLATESIHATLKNLWSDKTAWVVGRYVVLPDHIHLFATNRDVTSVRNWVGYWKAQCSREHPGNPGWLKGCWSRWMRSDQACLAQWEYVRLNPVRHGLVKNVDEWPYQGRLFHIG